MSKAHRLRYVSWRYRTADECTMIYHRKNLGLGAWWLAKLIYIGSNFIRMVAWFVMSIVNRDSRNWHRSAAARAALVYHLVGSEPK